MLHRSMAEYVHKSPDNQARTLLAYFSGMMVSWSVHRNSIALFFTPVSSAPALGKSGYMCTFDGDAPCLYYSWWLIDVGGGCGTGVMW